MTNENRPGIIDGIDVIGRPIGKYEQYEIKMRKLQKKLAFVKKHKVLIGVLTFLFIFAVLAFIYFIGTFTGELRYDDMIYGEEASYDIGCFFAKPSIEYSSDGEVFSSQTPSIPGKYYVRAVTQNPFGMTRYSGSSTFVLKPKPLKIYVTNTEIVYGDLSDEKLQSVTTVFGLKNGDRVIDTKYDLHYSAWNDITASVVSYSIINEKGEDASPSYDVDIQSGNIKLKKRSISFSTKSTTKTYDGSEWNDAELLIDKGSLASGDVIQCSFPVFSREVGKQPIIPSSLLILNSSGENVTHKYDVSKDFGDLIISPITLKFTTESATRIYNDSPLTAAGWTLIDGKLLEGHRIEAKTTGSQLYVGSSNNNLNVVVYDEKGKNISYNYSFSIERGVLKVEPIVLKFKTPSATKVYDGFALTADNWEQLEGRVLPNHKLYVFSEASITLAGSRKNSLNVIVQDIGFNDMVGKAYEVIVDEGTLEVTKRPITLTSGSASKLYDGRALVHHKFTVTQGSFAANNKIRNAKYSGTQTEVGSSPNYFDIVIGDGAYSNSTLSYDITYVYGTLEVMPNENFDPEDIDGDGIPNDYDSDMDGDGIPNEMDPDIDGDGEPNENDSDADGDGIIDTEEPTVIQTPPALEYVKLAEVDLQYPNMAHQLYLKNRSYGDYNGLGFEVAKVWDPYGDGSSASLYSPMNYTGMCAYETGFVKSAVYIRLYNNCPTIAPYYTYKQDKISLGNDVCFSNSNNNYTVEYMYTGNIIDLSPFSKMKQDPLVSDQEAQYRKHVYDTYLQIPNDTKQAMLRLAKENGILDNNVNTLSTISLVSKYIRSAGQYNLQAKPYPNDVDVAVYFLEVAKEGICQHFAASATMMFRALGIPARYTVGFFTTAKSGETTIVSTLNAHAWVEVYLDGIGWIPVEVTGSRPDDQMKIPLIVSAYNATKEYDGNPLGVFPGKKVSITGGYLLEGHTMYVTLSESGIGKTLPGSYKNRIVGVKILDSSGADVTDKYYELTALIPGAMTIEKRKITIQTGSASKIYDGEPLSCQDWYVTKGSILPGHYATVDLNKSITVVGSTLNNTVDIRIKEIGTNKDVTDRYDIETLFGILTVERAEG